MKKLQFDKTHNPSRLIIELQQIEGLKPINIDGEERAVFTINYKNNDIYLLVPDEVSAEAIEAVINEHIPTPLPPQPSIPTIEDYLIDLDFRLSMIELGL